jgi:hypothetical protein
MFAQYGRQAIYMECKLSNTFKTRSQKCDCINLSGLDKQSSELPVSNTHHHLHIDEFYPEVKILTIRSTPYTVSNRSNPFFIENTCEGVLNFPEKPPC